MQRQLTFLIALLMMTTGFATMAVAQPPPEPTPPSGASGAMAGYAACLQDPANQGAPQNCNDDGDALVAGLVSDVAAGQAYATALKAWQEANTCDAADAAASCSAFLLGLVPPASLAALCGPLGSAPAQLDNCAAMGNEGWYLVFKFHEGAADDRKYDDIALFVGPGASDPTFPPADYATASGDGPGDDNVHTFDFSQVTSEGPPEVSPCDVPAVVCNDARTHVLVPSDSRVNVDAYTFSDGYGVTLEDGLSVLIPTQQNLLVYALQSDLDADGYPDYIEISCDSNPTRRASTCADYDGDGVPNGEEPAGGARDPDVPVDDGRQTSLEGLSATVDVLLAEYLDLIAEELGNLGPSVDSDGDLVPDVLDNCPSVHNPMEAPTPGYITGLWRAANAAEIRNYLSGFYQRDTDADGLGDACEDDADDDGLDNNQEAEHGTDPLNPDTDGDGLLDGAEVFTHKTNPLRRYSDADDLDDHEEVTGILKPYGQPLPEDTPGGPGGFDRVDNRNPADPTCLCTRTYEGSHPTKVDTDAEGMSDSDEVLVGWVVPFQPVSAPPTYDLEDGDLGPRIRDAVSDQVPVATYDDPAPQPYWVFSNPNSKDQDGDKVEDVAEKAALANPRKADTDDDGVLDEKDAVDWDADQDNDSWSDGEEDLDKDGVFDNNESDFNGHDSDGDGLDDYFEKNIGWEVITWAVSNTEFRASDTVKPNPADPNDPFEGPQLVAYRVTTPYVKDSGSANSCNGCSREAGSSNRDGMNDLAEFLAKTDPLKGSTDGDGWLDNHGNERFNHATGAEDVRAIKYSERWSYGALDRDQDNDGRQDNSDGSWFMDVDRDHDDIIDGFDNCWADWNTLQEDHYGGPAGDRCSDSDGDGIPDWMEDSNVDEEGRPAPNGIYEPELGETKADNIDTDGDGFTDYEETEGVFNGQVFGVYGALLTMRHPIGILIGGLPQVPGSSPCQGVADGAVEMLSGDDGEHATCRFGHDFIYHGVTSDPNDGGSTPLTAFANQGEEAVRDAGKYPSADELLSDPNCRNPTKWGPGGTYDGCDSGELPDIPTEELVIAANTLATAAQSLAGSTGDNALTRIGRTYSTDGEGTTIGLSPTGALTTSGKPDVLVYVTATSDNQVYLWRDVNKNGVRDAGETANPCTGQVTCQAFFASLVAETLGNLCNNTPAGGTPACTPDDFDGDGHSNDAEAAAGSDPLDAASTPDDVDGDGVDDSIDNCVGTANPDQANTDKDYVAENGMPSGDDQGDACDDDDDADGVPDADDAFPLDRDEWADADGDGIGDNADADDDNDGVEDGLDQCHGEDDAEDLDGDGTPDGCDDNPADGLITDTDGDGIPDHVDPNPEEDDTNPDSDGDGMPNAVQPTFEANKCTAYKGQPVYPCYHGEAPDRAYYVFVFGIVVPASV